MTEPIAPNEIDSIDDEHLLKLMLDKSDDLEYRRLIRSRLRVINKTKQTSANEVDGANSKQHQLPARVHQPKDTTATTASLSTTPRPTSDVVDGRQAGGRQQQQQQQQQRVYSTSSNSSRTEQHSVTLRSVESNLRSNKSAEQPKEAVLESVPLRRVPDVKTQSADPPTKGDFLDGKQLRKVQTAKSSSEASRKPAAQQKADFLETVTLRKVEGLKVGGPSSTSGSSAASTRSTARSLTPKMAMQHFKGMDATTGSKDNGDGQKHRSVSPSNIRQAMLDWCRFRVYGYENVNIVDFSESWSNGMAFCALVHSFFPDAFDFDKLDPKEKRQNLQLAFTTAEQVGGVFPLLDVDDMMQVGSAPDWKCIFTYVNSIYAELSAASKKKTTSNDQQLCEDKSCEDKSCAVLDSQNDNETPIDNLQEE